jgi:hypothetical protein
LRINIRDRQTTPVDRDISQQRIAHAFMKSTGGGGTIVIQTNVLNLTASGFGHLVEQEAIN